DRLRLGADGYLRLCMASPLGLDLKTPLRAGASDAELSAMIQTSVWGKPAGHDFDRGLGAPLTLMSGIGG
ncbi:MAG: GTP 3',8-cyclase MoaA, partial [candidate division FCPU426 bacterium]